MKEIAKILKSSALRLLVVLVTTLFFVEYSSATTSSVTLGAGCSQSTMNDTEKLILDVEEEENEDQEVEKEGLKTPNISISLERKDSKSATLISRPSLGKIDLLFISFSCLKIP